MKRWILFLYQLPPEPSAPRVAVWRALKRLPGSYVLGGVYALRYTELRLLELGDLAHDVRNYGGRAVVATTATIDGEDFLERALSLAKSDEESSTGPRKAARGPRRPTPRRSRGRTALQR